ncbi:Gram-negative bacteria binding protein 1 [Carabus blaptoides fortunei]
MRGFIWMFVAGLAVCNAAKKCVKSPTKVSGSNAPHKICSGDLIFHENFHTLDFQKWKHENTLSGGGNWEFQWYTNNRSNSYVKNNRLYIKPTLTADVIGEDNLFKMNLDINGGSPADYCTDDRNWGCSRTGTPTNILNPIRSAKLTTVDSFAFKYGRVEFKAKMPTGDWLWPAIWMVPRYNVYSTWPASGEIDLVEARGNENLTQNGKNIGTEQAGSTLHWGPDPAHNGYMKTHFDKNSPGNGFNKDFRIYGFEWTPEYLKFSIDGEVLGIVKPEKSFWELGEFEKSGLNNPWVSGTKLAPFDEQFYLIINLAVGGVSYFPDDSENPVPKPWSNKSPTAMTDFWKGKSGWLPTWNLDKNNGEDAALQVDYIKVLAL